MQGWEDGNTEVFCVRKVTKARREEVEGRGGEVGEIPQISKRQSFCEMTGIFS